VVAPAGVSGPRGVRRVRADGAPDTRARPARLLARARGSRHGATGEATLRTPGRRHHLRCDRRQLRVRPGGPSCGGRGTRARLRPAAGRRGGRRVVAAARRSHGRSGRPDGWRRAETCGCGPGSCLDAPGMAGEPSVPTAHGSDAVRRTAEPGPVLRVLEHRRFRHGRSRRRTAAARPVRAVPRLAQRGDARRPAVALRLALSAHRPSAGARPGAGQLSAGLRLARRAAGAARRRERPGRRSADRGRDRVVGAAGALQPVPRATALDGGRSPRGPGEPAGCHAGQHRRAGGPGPRCRAGHRLRGGADRGALARDGPGLVARLPGPAAPGLECPDARRSRRRRGQAARPRHGAGPRSEPV
jgi:hypothetical protein